MAFAIVAHAQTETNLALASAWRAGETYGVLEPRQALCILGPVTPRSPASTCAGRWTESSRGLSDLVELERRGVRVLNRPEALLAGHDKLLCARLLESGHVPAPRTELVADDWSELAALLPLVIKPRFGSWGADVFLVEEIQLNRLERSSQIDPGASGAERSFRSPFRRSGSTCACSWRTGPWSAPSAGGRRRRVAQKRLLRRLAHDRDGRAAAAMLALDAVEMTCLELAVVDIMPVPGGGFCVLEVNAAPDFGLDYNSDENVFEAVVERLQLAAETGSRLSALDAA